MRNILRGLILCVFVVLSSGIYAAPPVINNDVHVMQHATPAQCNGSWEGSVGTDIETVDSGFGNNNEISGAGIRSCTGCAVDVKTQDCVCKTCYDHFDN